MDFNFGTEEYTLLSALRKRHVKKLRQAKRGAGRKKTTRPRRKRGGATYTRVWQRIVPPREARENGGFFELSHAKYTDLSHA